MFLFYNKFLSLACMFFLSLATLHAQETADMTSSELSDAAIKAYEEGNYQRAIQLFEQYKADYGDSAEGKQYLLAHRPFLALCLARTGSYKSAIGLIKKTLPQKKIDPLIREELLFWKGVCHYKEGDTATAQKTFHAYV